MSALQWSLFSAFLCSAQHLTLGIKALLEIIEEMSSSLFKRFFICVNMYCLL